MKIAEAVRKGLPGRGKTRADMTEGKGKREKGLDLGRIGLKTESSSNERR